MTLTRVLAATVVAVALCLPLPAFGDEVISTYDTWVAIGSGVFSQMGEEPSVSGTDATYGQTFTPPITAPMLKQFSVWLSDPVIIHPDPLDFRGYVMEWTGTSATGPILYESETLTADGMAHGTNRRFDIGPIDKMLDPAKQYVFFLSCSLLFDGVDSWTWVGGMSYDAYPGGHFVVLGNQNDFSKVYTNEWSLNPFAEMAFEATFDLPEPGAALALLPMAALIASHRRRCPSAI